MGLDVVRVIGAFASGAVFRQIYHNLGKNLAEFHNNPRTVGMEVVCIGCSEAIVSMDSFVYILFRILYNIRSSRTRNPINP